MGVLPLPGPRPCISNRSNVKLWFLPWQSIVKNKCRSEKLNFVEINYQHRNSYLVTSIYIHYNAEKSTCRQMNKCPTIPTYPNITKYVLLREETSMYVWNKIYLTVQCSLPCILLEVLSQHILNYSDVANNKLDNFLYGASAAYWEAKLITKSL